METGKEPEKKNQEMETNTPKPKFEIEEVKNKNSEITGKYFTRILEFDREAVNSEQRTIELSFSSETEYERWYGIEILDHNKKSIRLDRINSGAPVLVNHDPDRQAGVVEKAWIDSKNKKGKALVRFGKSTFANEIFSDIQDGIRRNVSVSYINWNMVLEEQDGETMKYRVMDWEPLEISIVAVPADYSVGIGRSLEMEMNFINQKKEKEMENEKKQTGEVNEAEILAQERARTREIRSIAKKFRLEEEGEKAIESGMEVAAFKDFIIEKFKTREETLTHPPKIEVGTDRETLQPWKKFSEFLYAVAFNRADKRLLPLYYHRAQSMGVGAAGGFALPDQFRETLLQLTPQEAHIRPRAQVIPPGDPPDAKLIIPALDQSTSHDIYGGVQVSWIAEGTTKPEAKFYLRQVELEPKEVAGYMDVTDKLLRNWDACSALVQRQFRLAVISAEDNAFLTGNGVGKPLGILATANASAITISRASANAIAYQDIRGIYARFMMRGGSGVWIASQTTIPQLMAIKDDGSSLIWQPNAREGMPGTIFGYPVVISERVPVLGSRGDLSLIDASYYLIKDGSGPIFESTNAVRFKENITTFKITWNVDGQPWFNTPVPLEVANTSTVSPFVVLA